MFSNKTQLISSKPYKIKIVIYAVPQSINRIGNRFWVKIKATKKWHEMIEKSVKYLKPNRPLERFSITINRHSSRALDYDNAIISYKAVIDGLKHSGIIKDDRASIIKGWTIEHVQRPRKFGQLSEITIEEIEVE